MLPTSRAARIVSIFGLGLLSACSAPQVIHVTSVQKIDKSDSQPAIGGLIRSVCPGARTGYIAPSRALFTLRADLYALNALGYKYVGTFSAPVSDTVSQTISLSSDGDECLGVALQTSAHQQVIDESRYTVDFKLFSTQGIRSESIANGSIKLNGVPTYISRDNNAVISGPQGYLGKVYGWGGRVTSFYSNTVAYKALLTVSPGPLFVSTAIRRTSDYRISQESIAADAVKNASPLPMEMPGATLKGLGDGLRQNEMDKDIRFDQGGIGQPIN